MVLVVVTALEAVTYFPAIPQAPTLISLAILKFFLIASIYMPALRQPGLLRLLHDRPDPGHGDAGLVPGLFTDAHPRLPVSATAPTPAPALRRAVAGGRDALARSHQGERQGRELPVAEGAEWVWPFVPDIVLGLMVLVVLYALTRGVCGGACCAWGPGPSWHPRGP